MRMWPYQMFDVLPYRHMLSQWRECLAISGMFAKDIENFTGINHYIIDRVKEYDIEHFVVYCYLVQKEFKRREWTIGTNTIEKLNNDIDFENRLKDIEILYDEDYDNNHNVNIMYNNKKETLFYNFHNERYITQCLYKFQEMYDCNGITEEQWKAIHNKFESLIKF